MLPEQSRRVLRERCQAIRDRFSIAPEAEIKAAHAGIYWACYQRGFDKPNAQIAYLRHLTADEAVDLFVQMARTFASIDGAATAAVLTRVCDIYDPCWLTEQTAYRYTQAVDPAFVPPHRVMPEHVYLRCYQTLLQRVSKHAREVGAREVQVIQDAHEYLDAERRFENIHHLLAGTDHSWGENLQLWIDEVASTQVSHHHPGLQGADFMASALCCWVRGKNPRWAPPFADIVRKHKDRYAQIGMIGVPKGCRLSEVYCQAVLKAVRDGEQRPPSLD